MLVVAGVLHVWIGTDLAAQESAERLARHNEELAQREEAGLPPGVFNVVIGNADVGQQLSSHPGVDRVGEAQPDQLARAVPPGPAAGAFQRL